MKIFKAYANYHKKDINKTKHQLMPVDPKGSLKIQTPENRKNRQLRLENLVDQKRVLIKTCIKITKIIIILIP